MTDRRQRDGFTLIELLVVIAIIATLLAVAVPNFLGARERARDAKKKAEISQLKSALRLYYNDYNRYPADSGGPMGNVIKGCGVNGTGDCSLFCTTVGFAAGGTGCDTVYMKKFPSDWATSMFYYQLNGNTDDFCLKVPLDNASDAEIAKSQSKCGATALGAPCYQKASGNDFAVCAD